MQGIGSVALVFVLLCVSSSWGQDEAPSSAPWLGDEKYSIEFEGALRDALNALGELTGRSIRRETRPPRVDLDRPVRLQFEEATLDRILLSVCEQAGVVYDPPAALARRGDVVLRPGDPRLDPRPVAVVGEYVLRVDGTVLPQSHRGTSVRWGEPAPSEAPVTDRVGMWLHLEARSREAFARVAHIEQIVRVSTDERVVFEAGAQPVDRARAVLTHGGRFSAEIVSARAHIPVPAEMGPVIATLEGTLKLHSEVKMVEVRIEPDSVGETLVQDEVTVTVSHWQQPTPGDRRRQHPGSVRLDIPPQDPQRLGDLHWVVVVAGDGREMTAVRPLAHPIFGHRSRTSDGSRTLSVLLPPWDVDHLKLIVARRGPADVQVPFVIRDIPLP